MQIALRDACVPRENGQTLFDGLRLAGVGCVELLIDTEGSIPSVGFPLHDVASLRRRLGDEGISVCALLLETDFCGDAAESHVRRSIDAVAAAAELGVSTVRLDGHTRKEIGAAAVRKNLARQLRRILTETPAGVDIGLENHAVFLNDPAFLDELLADVADPRLGVTLDTANFYWFGYPLDEVYALIGKYAPRAKHTHIKSINYPPQVQQQRRAMGWEYRHYCCGLDEGNLDLRRVVQLLRDGGYERALCIEDESLAKHPPSERLERVQREVEALRVALS
jgi:sugar phosphate isomerase/epimerase